MQKWYVDPLEGKLQRRPPLVPLAWLCSAGDRWLFPLQLQVPQDKIPELIVMLYAQQIGEAWLFLLGVVVSALLLFTSVFFVGPALLQKYLCKFQLTS